MGKTEKSDVEATTKSIARIDFNAHKHGYTTLVDEGDPAVPDFTLGDFITDANPHTLDLSTWAGERETYVLLGSIITLGAEPGGLRFRTKGNTSWLNAGSTGGGPGIGPVSKDIEVSTNADGEVEYQASPGPWVQIDVTVRGVQA